MPGEKPEGKIHVIGVAPGSRWPEDSKARSLLERADLLVGREELISEWRDVPNIPLRGNLKAAIAEAEKVRARGGTVLFLVSGDPNFFGIASLLRKTLGKDKVVTYPAVSSMQMAFSRIGESWHDAHFLSAHARPSDEVLEGLRNCHKACVLTSDGKQPAALARAMLERGLDHFRVFLCQELGGPEERVEEVSLKDLTGRECRPMNLLVFLYEEGRAETGCVAPALLGIDDELFAAPPGRSGRMTKRDLRAVAISRLELSPGDVLWDVGAGCGTLSIEASRFLFRGTVYAVEEHEEDLELIKENIRRFGALNVRPVKGVAPEIFDRLPSPDAVFVGGSSGRLEDIVLSAAERLGVGGRMVCNLVGLERTLKAKRCLEEAGLLCEAFLHQVIKLRRLGADQIMEPRNPVFVLSGRKRGGGKGE